MKKDNPIYDLTQEALEFGTDLTKETNGDGEERFDHTMAYLRDMSKEEGLFVSDKEWNEAVDYVIYNCTGEIQ